MYNPTIPIIYNEMTMELANFVAVSLQEELKAADSEKPKIE